MYPYIELFNKSITTYSLMVLVGIFVSSFLACKFAKKEFGDYYDMVVLMLVSSIGVFFGAHLLYGITNLDILIRVISHFDKIKSFSDFISIFAYIFGGSVFYGGLIGGLIVSSIYIKLKKLNKKIYYDIIAVIIPLFHFFGRIGCFLVGCCYGMESKIGFIYTRSLIDSANHVRRFPIQLVEACYNLILFLVLYHLYKRKKLSSKLIYVYLVSYSIGRFILEFFRGDSYRGFLCGMSTSQIISVLILIYVIIINIIKRIKVNKMNKL